MGNFSNKKRIFRLAMAFFAMAGLASERAWGADYDSSGNAIHFNQQMTLGPDTYAGFYWFKNGIVVNDNATLGINGFIGGASSIALDKVLTFTRDLYFASDATLDPNTGGIISSNGKTLFLGGDFSIATGKTLKAGNLIINGQGHKLSLLGSAKLLVDSSVSVTLQNMILDIDDVYGLDCYYNGDLTLNNVLINIGDSGYTFTSGRLHIQNDVSINGDNQTMNFDPHDSGYMNIYPNSVLNIGLTTIFAYKATQNNKFRMTDATSWLYVNGATLEVDPGEALSGLTLIKGTLILDNKVTMNNDVNADANKAIKLGDGASADNDMNVLVLSGAQVEVKGYLHWNPAGAV